MSGATPEEEVQTEEEKAAAAAAEAGAQKEDLTPTEDNEVPAPAELLDMSDEDFEKMDAAPAPAEAAEELSDEEEQPAGEKTKPAATETAAAEPKKEEPAAPATGSETKLAAAETAPAGSRETEVSSEDKVKIYDALFGTFKANGRDMQVTTPEEAQRLMQMGAGHLKYQAKVRPALAIEQTLKNNKIDQNKLNFLIDCANGKPEAIKKLVRDAKIEPYDIESTEESRQQDENYRPTNHIVSDDDMLLTETIGTVQGTPTGDAVLKDIRAEWDDDSRTKLVGDPEILNILVNQKNLGIYDRITSEVDRRRVLGTLAKNIPWLDAYHQVGQDMANSGAFSTEGSTNPTVTETAPAQTESKVIEQAAAKKNSPAGGDPSGVAPVTQTAVVPPKVDASVMDMSDKEFAELEAKFG